MQLVPGLATLFCGLALFSAAAGAGQATVTGTAAYRERIALPPNAVFSAVLADVSRADAPAVELGRAVIDPAGHPPYRFAIAYDASRIEPQHTYAVRAGIAVDGRPMFVTDTMHPVLTRGAGSEVDIVLKMARAEAAQPAAKPAVAPGAARFHGMVVYFADSASIRECHTGRRYPIAMEAQFLELQRVYAANRAEPAAPLLMALDGRVEPRPRMEGGGEEPTFIVDQVAGSTPGATCDSIVAPASLTDTHWEFELLGGEFIRIADGERPPYLLLQAATKSYSATAGCNMLGGGFEAGDGGALKLLPGFSTMMACPPPLDKRELALRDLIDTARSAKIDGMVMTLHGADGAELARLRAVLTK
jgi:uncharacterized lipoprotein YbaY/heat shock protein HslJ